MTSPLFHVSPGSLAHAAAGDRLILDGPEGRHAATVMRIAAGEHVLLSDTRSTRARAVVEARESSRHDGAAGGLCLQLLEVGEEAVESPRLILLQALAKDKRDLQAVESATELGVDGVIPWQAERSVVRWKPAARERKHAEWVSLVAAASKQSRRTSVPEVGPLQTTAEFVGGVAERFEAAVVVLHEDAERTLSTALEEAGACGPSDSAAVCAELYLVIGPEGGISERELALLSDAGALPARLGPTVLRSSSAGAAALAAVNVLLGRWDRPAAPMHLRVE